MAIALDTTSVSHNTTGTSLTWAHTATGSNLGIFVYILIVNPTDVLTGVTYAGTSMTSISSAIHIGSVSIYLYFLGNGPASGTNNVVVSTSASVQIFGASASYTGVKQTNTVDASQFSGPTTTTSLTVSVTTVADNAWLVGFARDDGPTFAMSAGTNTFKRAQFDSNDFSLLLDTNAAQTPAGVHSLNVTTSSAVPLAMIVASIAPAVASSTTKTLAALGVG